MIALIGQNNKTLGIQNITLSGTYTFDNTAKSPTVVASPSNPVGYPIVSGTQTNAGTYTYTAFSWTIYGGYQPSYSGALIINQRTINLSLGQSFCFNDGSGYGNGFINWSGGIDGVSFTIQVVNTVYGIVASYNVSSASGSQVFFTQSVFFGAGTYYGQVVGNSNYTYSTNSFQSGCF